MTDALKNLLRASYEGVEFPVSEQPTTGSHTIVKRAAYRQAGFDLDHGGYDGSAGSLVAPLFNGLRGWGNDLFPGTFLRLKNKFISTPIGQLIHPIEGVMTVAVMKWSHAADPTKRNGVSLSFEWVQQGAASTNSLLLFRNDSRDAPAAVAQRAAVADAVANGATGATVAPSGYQPTADTVSEQLSYLEEATRSRSEVQSAISTMLSVVGANLSLLDAQSDPSLYSELTRDLFSLRAAVLQTRARYLLNTDKSAVFVVPHDMAVWEIAANPNVYGDARFAYLITDANNISNPLLVRAGTRVEIPPRE